MAFSLRYEAVVKRFLAHGTTTVNYFGTCHLEGTKRLATICDRLGQRAVIGRVSMDQYTTEKMKRDVHTDLFETTALVDFITRNCSNRIMPSIIPRFSPTCTHNFFKDQLRVFLEFWPKMHFLAKIFLSRYLDVYQSYGHDFLFRLRLRS